MPEYSLGHLNLSPDGAELDPITATLRTLFMILSLHLIGYLTVAHELLSKQAEQGLMAFVATIGLPSLLFTSVCRLDVAHFRWEVVAAVLAAKLILLGIGFAFSIVATRRNDNTGFAYTLGGTIALMATMSDDMGIGFPVLLSQANDVDERTRLDGRILHLVILSALRACAPQRAAAHRRSNEQALLAVCPIPST
jgi:hypothetical protein